MEIYSMTFDLGVNKEYVIPCSTTFSGVVARQCAKFG